MARVSSQPYFLTNNYIVCIFIFFDYLLTTFCIHRAHFVHFDLTHIYKIYNINTKHQAAAMRRRPGPAPRRPGRTGTRASGPGRAATAWPSPCVLHISCISCISCIYLYIFVYILIYFNILCIFCLYFVGD